MADPPIVSLAAELRVGQNLASARTQTDVAIGVLLTALNHSSVLMGNESTAGYERSADLARPRSQRSGFAGH